MQAQRANLAEGGRIAIIASRMGSSKAATGGAFAYRASKAAAVNLGLNFAEELRPDGIAIGTDHPGWVRTEMGGASADLSVGEAARGPRDRFEALDMDRSGCFVTYDGAPVPI